MFLLYPFRYSATNLLWHFCGFGSEHNRQIFDDKLYSLLNISTIARDFKRLIKLFSYKAQSLSFLYLFNISFVGARMGSCLYLMLRSLLQKYLRSCPFVNPRSCDLLLRRISKRRPIFAFSSVAKNSSALFLLDPIVNNIIDL